MNKSTKMFVAGIAVGFAACYFYQSYRPATVAP